MYQNQQQRGLTSVALIVVIALSTIGLARGPATAESTAQQIWSPTWSTSPQRPSAGFTPSWAETGFANHTVRQVVRLSVGGSTIRVSLTNEYGTSPLSITGATIAKSTGEANVAPGSLRQLTFRGSRSTVIPPGSRTTSDAALFSTDALQTVTITLYLRERTGPATFHSQANATTYQAAGDHRNDVTGEAFNEKTLSWYYLTDIEIASRSRAGKAVVAFGDSITDGVGSTIDANNRYPDKLAEYLGSAGKPRPVLNQGIAANRVLNDSAWYGEKATGRFQRDVLSKSGVGTVIILAGINDIGFNDWDNSTAEPKPAVSVEQLIAGHRELARRAHAQGITVIGTTLLPYKGSLFYTDRGEEMRDALNKWIRTSGVYDAVVDFDRLMADSGNRNQLNPAYDSGDHLHPNDAGYRVMARAINPTRIR